MSGVAERLASAGLVLPAPPAPVGAYAPAVLAGDLVFVSGQLPLRDGALLAAGLVGEDVDLDTARACAQAAALNALAAASGVCDLDDVSTVVRLAGYVACGPRFTMQPKVVDAASELMLAAFGGAGRHARAAVGVASLPLGAPVELEVVLRVAGHR